MESHEAGFLPFPLSLEIPAGFPHSHGLDDGICLVAPLNSIHRHRKGLVTDVSGPQRNACPGTLTFRYVFNNERPHEGLNNQVPASLYHPSSVRLPRKLPEFTYPKGLLLRRVNNSGDISWHKSRIFISEVFRFEELAFELITPGFYRVFFRDMEIGELNVEELRFRAARRVV